MRTGTPTGRLVGVLLTGAATRVLTLITTTTASAHDEVIATSPAAAASLTAAASTVELEVSSPPQEASTEVPVSGPTGGRLRGAHHLRRAGEPGEYAFTSAHSGSLEDVLVVE